MNLLLFHLQTSVSQVLHFKAWVLRFRQDFHVLKPVINARELNFVKEPLYI